MKRKLSCCSVSAAKANNEVIEKIIICKSEVLVLQESVSAICIANMQAIPRTLTEKFSHFDSFRWYLSILMV